jgi:glutathione-regulated potassium-efflux system protein KefB
MHLPDLLLAAVVLLAVAIVAALLFERLGFGSVLGLIVSGVVLGPSGLAIAGDVTAFREFTELGVVLLLFLIGLEMRPDRLWSMRRSVFGLGAAQVLVTGLALTVYAALYGLDWRPALLVGFGFALSSTALVTRSLQASGELHTPFGQSAFAVLLFQDLVIVLLLALVPLLAGGLQPEPRSFWLNVLEVLAALAFVVVLGRVVLPFVFKLASRQGGTSTLLPLTLFAVLAAAWAMEQADLSMALGAFLIGMTGSDSPYRHVAEALIEPFKELIIGLFFIAVGMSIDLAVLAEIWPRVIIYSIGLVALKVLILFGLARLFRLDLAASARLGLSLAQCGEFGFVLFAAGLAAGVLDPRAHAFSVTIVSLTMAVTPILERLGAKLAAQLSARVPMPLPDSTPSAGAPVLVAGYGRVGRLVCDVLASGGIEPVVIDRDPAKVLEGRAAGRSVRFGNHSDVHVLRHAGLDDARLLVLATGDPHAAERTVGAARALRADLPIIARAHNEPGARHLRRLGATLVVLETYEASLQLGAAALHKLGQDESTVEEVLRTVREQEPPA